MRRSGGPTPFTHLTRRFAALSFLQWLPVGLTMAPFVLLLLERGLNLAQISLLGAVSAVTVALLELPTGGLADTFGRRPVLVASALASAAGLLLLALAPSLPLLVVSSVLVGLARALGSGPLEAWYVDRVHVLHGVDQHGREVTTGLSRGEVACSAALAAGTVTGGLLPLVVAGLPLTVDDLAVPILLGAGVELLRTVVSSRIGDTPRARAPLAAVVREVPGTIRAGLGLAVRDRVVLRLLATAAATGVALAVVELVTPAWLDELTGDPRRAALFYAVIITVGFGADAVGAAGAPVLRRRLGTPSGAAAAASAVALAAALSLVVATSLTGAVALLVAGVAYVTMFAGLGAAGPPLGELLHGRVSADRRATMLSVQSLMLQAAGASGAVLAGVLTARFGPAAGLGVACVGVATATWLLARMRRHEPSAANVPAGRTDPARAPADRS